MKRRTFFKLAGATLTASFAPALPAFTAPVVTMLPRPRSYSIPATCHITHPPMEWLLDAAFDNLQNQPPLDGTFHVSLYTADGDISK